MIEDYKNPLDEGMSDQLALSPLAVESLRTAGKWGKFLAIVGFVFMGLAILGMLLGGSSLLYLMSGTDSMGAAGFGTLLFLFYGAIFAFAIYVYWQLYQFSINALRAADSGSQAAVTDSLKSLATLFKITGIVTVIFLGFYGLAIIAMIFGAAVGGL